MLPSGPPSLRVPTRSRSAPFPPSPRPLNPTLLGKNYYNIINKKKNSSKDNDDDDTQDEWGERPAGHAGNNQPICQ